MEYDCILKQKIYRKLTKKRGVKSCATCLYYDTDLCLKDRNLIKRDDKHHKMREGQE